MIKLEDWQPSDGLTLETNALRAATERERCLALTAGPGAGKTEMLAQRADFLLRTGTCRYPKRILAISFKVDASCNLKKRVRRRCGQDLSGRFDSYTFHAFAKRIIDRFRSVLTGDDALNPDYKIVVRKTKNGEVEFGDLVSLAIQILEESQVARNAIRKTYSDVFLDEFQDCTDKQYALIKLAFKGTAIRLTAVGDTKQRIMAWAGALEGVFSTFAGDFNALQLNMYLNFRSKARLLRMQNEIIRVLDPVSVMPEAQILGNEGDIHAWHFETTQHEAEYLADLIARWVKDEGVPLSEIAILLRQQLDLYANLLMIELEKRGIPYRNEQQLQDLSVEPVARLIIDYLLSLFGSQEPAAWLRLMDQLIPFADESEQAEMRQDWLHFIKLERKEAALLGMTDVSWPAGWKLVKKFLKKFGLSNMTSLSPEYESSARLKEVIQETKTRIEDLLNIEPDFVKALTRFCDDQAVHILTIHKSKGLEFDSVIMLGVEDQTFWGNKDENCCIYFVGVSRAKRRLVLTCAQERPKPEGFGGVWKVARTPHQEFLEYAVSFME
ncbi:ATP-dependent helicase [Methylobacter sp.]|uniref:ATP-dependent helicase n=1 Tax=Methylobacter sp. TaxID=2051955 RepID=UPI002FDDB378